MGVFKLEPVEYDYRAASEVSIEVENKVRDLLNTLRELGRGDEMAISLIQGSIEQLRKRDARSTALTDAQATFLIESGTFTPESLKTTEERIARGDLAQLEGETRLEAITGSLSAAEVATKLNIDVSRVRHRLAKGSLYAFLVGGKRRYPTWQFTEDKNQPVAPHLATVVKSFPDDMHPATIQNIMTTPNHHLIMYLEVFTPVEWLQFGGSPQRVVDIFDGFLQS